MDTEPMQYRLLFGIVSGTFWCFDWQRSPAIDPFYSHLMGRGCVLPG